VAVATGLAVPGTSEVKPRNREVNIFNMSVPDLLTGALGAFCFLTLALFPSYFKAHNPSVANEHHEARQQRTEKQFGKAKKGIPPFSLAEISAVNDKGNGCGFFKVDGVQAPRGSNSLRRLPFSAGSEAEGYERYNCLFLFDPGPYRLTATAYATSLPCRIQYAQQNEQGSTAPVGVLTNSPAPYLFNFELKPEQLITSILPHR
jgi:hypothetical protein